METVYMNGKQLITEILISKPNNKTKDSDTCYILNRYLSLWF